MFLSRGDRDLGVAFQTHPGEENNRMGKPRDLFKKIRDTKGILYATAANCC